MRVACPARGATLASGRIERWLSVLDFLAEKTTGNGLVADGVDFLLAVVEKRTDPCTLPGIEAMMPGSALTRQLQQPPLICHANRTVIAGDIEGESLWQEMKIVATDWFYRADHDLVVNAGSMSGGLRRPEKDARFRKDQGPDVNHFSYFANARSVRGLIDDFYGPLLEFLARTHRVEFFAYDWQLSVGEAAAKLAAKLDTGQAVAAGHHPGHRPDRRSGARLSWATGAAPLRTARSRSC
ncbi:hypothetical protein [Accumulibacter sp.]|uniref:hypothetical protein n=1 Tax=Accumulibacter sp. TaxID=2053492 RepID=UPI001A3A5F5F|nr:hypothetical protein [Accumulibacter sp.]MBL8373150.1 hypothetical protein [Accumulibacter sp.]